jgi:glycosyltransferase involved in cell wall biosynthesis
MKICMVVHNNGTRDGRVMREAHSLQAAGHAVTVVGIPESHAAAPMDVLSDGVTVYRVQWQARAKYRVLTSAIPRSLLFLALLAALGFGLLWVLAWLFSSSGPVQHLWAPAWWIASGGGYRPAMAAAYVALAAVGAACILCGIAILGIRASRRRAREDDRVRREVVAGADCAAAEFPAIRSRIPNWLPDWALEIAAELPARLGGRMGSFSTYRYRWEELAAAAIKLKPDVVHCHDCISLPAGWIVKKALGIPLVYDAHEIYEAVAARRFGTTDYFARAHSKYLPRIDGFIAVNDSAARYYRHAFPTAPRAVVIRNATDHVADGPYDGRLHRAVGVPLDEKILLYQGGFTNHRGLQILVRSAALLPAGWSLVMMGWGSLSGELQRIAAADPAAAGKVHFVAAVPAAELLLWTQGASAGIIPYEDKMLNHWIATPNKLWEYPSAGVPLIVQPFPEMRRIVETYRCGWVLPPEFSPAAIAGLVASLTDEMLAEARAGCRAFIEKDNWSVYRLRLLELYDNMARRVAAQNAVGKTLSPAAAPI